MAKNSFLVQVIFKGISDWKPPQKLVTSKIWLLIRKTNVFSYCKITCVEKKKSLYDILLNLKQ